MVVLYEEQTMTAPKTLRFDGLSTNVWVTKGTKINWTLMSNKDTQNINSWANTLRYSMLQSVKALFFACQPSSLQSIPSIYKFTPISRSDDEMWLNKFVNVTSRYNRFQRDIQFLIRRGHFDVFVAFIREKGQPFTEIVVGRLIKYQ